jgi:hypothetical protein
MAAERLIGEVKNIIGEPHFWSKLNSDARVHPRNEMSNLNPCVLMSLKK